MDELNRAIAQIDTTTQQNASTVEELANTSDNLSNEAKELTMTVARFKVSQEEQASKQQKHPLKKIQVRPETDQSSSSRFEDDFEEF